MRGQRNDHWILQSGDHRHRARAVPGALGKSLIGGGSYRELEETMDRQFFQGVLLQSEGEK